MMGDKPREPNKVERQAAESKLEPKITSVPQPVAPASKSATAENVGLVTTPAVAEPAPPPSAVEAKPEVPPARVVPREPPREVVGDTAAEENAKRVEETKARRDAERKARKERRVAERKRQQRDAERRMAEERRAREEELHAREEKRQVRDEDEVEEVVIERQRASTERPRARIIEADGDENVGRVVVRQEPVEERADGGSFWSSFGR
jgi:hypothetical protein